MQITPFRTAVLVQTALNSHRINWDISAWCLSQTSEPAPPISLPRSGADPDLQIFSQTILPPTSPLFHHEEYLFLWFVPMHLVLLGHFQPLPLKVLFKGGYEAPHDLRWKKSWQQLRDRFSSSLFKWSQSFLLPALNCKFTKLQLLLA